MSFIFFGRCSTGREEGALHGARAKWGGIQFSWSVHKKSANPQHAPAWHTGSKVVQIRNKYYLLISISVWVPRTNAVGLQENGRFMATENKNQHKVQVGINLIFSRLFNLSARSFHNDWIVKTQSKKQESTLTKQHCFGKNYERGSRQSFPSKQVIYWRADST